MRGNLKGVFVLFGLTLLLIIGGSTSMALTYNQTPALTTEGSIYTWQNLGYQNNTNSINGTPFADTSDCNDLNWTGDANCAAQSGTLINYSGQVIRQTGVDVVASTKYPRNTWTTKEAGFIIVFDAFFNNTQQYRAYYNSTDEAASPSTYYTNLLWGTAGDSNTRTVQQFNNTGLLPYTHTSNYTALGNLTWHKIQIEHIYDQRFTIFVDDKIVYDVPKVNISQLVGTIKPIVGMSVGGWSRSQTGYIGNLIYYTTVSQPTLNVSIKNEITRGIINENFTMNFINSNTTILQVNGSLNNTPIPVGETGITYSGAGFGKREYYFNGVLGNDYTVSLFALDDTNASTLTYTVNDENFDALENATLQALRFYPQTNAYEVVEMDRSSFDGTGNLRLEQGGVFYKFRIIYQGTTLLTTEGTEINTGHVTNGLNFQVNTLNNPLQVIDSVLDVGESLTFNTATNTFSLGYVDTGGVVAQTCLEVTKEFNFHSLGVNKTCSTSDSATLVIVVDNTTNSDYVARAIHSPSLGDDITTQELRHSFRVSSTASLLGSMGIFAAFLIVLTAAMAGIWKPEAGIVMAGAAFTFTVFIGLLDMSRTVSIAVFLGSLIIAGVMNRRTDNG